MTCQITSSFRENTAKEPLTEEATRRCVTATRTVFILVTFIVCPYRNRNLPEEGSATLSERESSGKTQVYTYTCINITSSNDSDSVLRDRLLQNGGSNGRGELNRK